jgi:hypothetical protein
MWTLGKTNLPSLQGDSRRTLSQRVVLFVSDTQQCMLSDPRGDSEIREIRDELTPNVCQGLDGSRYQG